MDNNDITIITLDGEDYIPIDITQDVMDVNAGTGTIFISSPTFDFSNTGLFASSDTASFTFDWVEDQSIIDEYKAEKDIRERNEGVQKAWEQYKIMVELARMPPEPDDE